MLLDVDGVTVVDQAVDLAAIDRLLQGYLDFVAETTGRRFDDPHGSDLIDFYKEQPSVEAAVYDGIRRTTLLVDFSLTLAPVAATWGADGLLTKIPFRIDLPHETRELSPWHQDRFYVRGDPRTLTLWVPLQDTGMPEGCLAVMPGTHRLGLLDHDLVIGKRNVPSSVLDREIRLVPVRKGDVVIFHADLVHSSTVNVSETIRYSVQARFIPAGGLHDPAMGGLIESDA